MVQSYHHNSTIAELKKKRKNKPNMQILLQTPFFLFVNCNKVDKDANSSASKYKWVDIS